jgi:hypothetical protein
MAKAVFGIAKSQSQAIAIADQLKIAGFSVNDISVLLPDKQGTKDFAHEQHTKAPEGAATGATGGAVLGACPSNRVFRILATRPNVNGC